MSKGRRKRASQKAIGDRWASNLAEIATELASYNAEDVVVALSVSELWLPNISAIGKHYLAQLVFGSIPPYRFRRDRRIAQYAEFVQFLTSLYGKLPSFLSLEDFVPETDWGEVKVMWERAPQHVFYGACVERVPDYIAAFELQQRSNPDAIGDMSIALKIQDLVIRQIDRTIVGDARNIDAGQMEIPSERFWLECSHVLRTVIADAGMDQLPPRLVMRQGDLKLAKTVEAFADQFMIGQILPGIAVEVDDHLIPVSVRNMPTFVVDFWAGKDRAGKHEVDGGIAGTLADFITRRVDNSALIRGPVRIARRDLGPMPYRFAAAISTAGHIYLVLPITEAHILTLIDLERDIDQLAADGAEWAFELVGQRKVVQFARDDGNLPSADMISVVAVIASSGTAVGAVGLPETRAQVVFLADFITILDSVEDMDELSRFWAYNEENRSMLFGMAGSVDVFGSFRQSDEVLIEGAISPTMMFLDPHGGSNWRFEELAEFWKNAPSLFPDDLPAWRFKAPAHGVQTLLSKGAQTLSSSTSLNGCAVHFLLPPHFVVLESVDRRMLSLMVQCLPDAISQRRVIFENHPIFLRKRIVTMCVGLPATEDNGAGEDTPLFDDWVLDPRSDETSLYVRVRVNLARARAGFNEPHDARFEVECAAKWLGGLVHLLDISDEGITTEALAETGRGLPRFTAKLVSRVADVPEFVHPDVPQPSKYKLARRNLAQIFKDLGIEPGRYQLEEAKVLIDRAHTAYRALIHARIAILDRTTLVTSCIGQIDALATEFQRAKFTLRESFAHEVEYDRSANYSEAYRKFTDESRNYRYLLECKLSMPDTGAESFTNDELMDLLANIDWLLVLYGASDVLYYGIEVAGIEISDHYVPKIFYSEGRQANEAAFSREMADSELTETARSTAAFLASKDAIDGAFRADLGFSLTELMACILVLCKWPTYREDTDFHLWYWAAPDEIIATFVKSVIDLSAKNAAKIVEFMILQPDQIRRLLGEPEDKWDVPIWDHIKRGSRYTIRPLVRLEDGRLVWGAASAERCLSIWSGAISDGYLPANFPWPNVRASIDALKTELDNQLESDAYDVISKFAPHAEPDMDFKSRFPKERFEDVGDFDVLAYWPECNLWLSVECKYNKPPFCLKDSRRLRDEIFGRGRNRGQFSKIERRREFLTTKFDHLRELLKWPAPPPGCLPQFVELYVSPSIFWWMRFPPYEMATEFVRLGALETLIGSRFPAR